MRKDVKFGLTVGGILVATLVVYVIVLSGGGLNNAAKQDNKTSLAINTDTTPTPTTPAASDNSSTSTPQAHADNSTISTTGNPLAAQNQPAPAPAPTPLMDSTPATQPAVSSNNNDWDYRLSHGGDSLPPGQTQHTETPSIDNGSSFAARPLAVNAQNRPPTIDNASPLLALSAPADQPAAAVGPTTQPVANDDAMVTIPEIPTTPNSPAIAPPPTVNSQRTHVVASGESLWTIAESVYGNGSYYTKIVAANPGINASNLKVGKTLIIPDMPAAQKSTSSSSTSDTSAPAAVDSSTSYRVVSGDTLEKIARKLYGDANMQDKLYDANKSLMGDSPDRLKIGWVLKLPKAPTVSQ